MLSAWIGLVRSLILTVSFYRNRLLADEKAGTRLGGYISNTLSQSKRSLDGLTDLKQDRRVGRAQLLDESLAVQSSDLLKTATEAAVRPVEWLAGSRTWSGDSGKRTVEVIGATMVMSLKRLDVSFWITRAGPVLLIARPTVGSSAVR